MGAATQGGSGTGRRAEIMHFSFPQMNKKVPYTPPLPDICLLSFKKGKDDNRVFTFSLVTKMLCCPK